MVLAVHGDTSYLSEAKARSQAGGHFFMSSNANIPPNNRAVLNVAQIFKAVMSSAAEVKIGAMFINAREAVPTRKILEEMGHPQPKNTNADRQLSCPFSRDKQRPTQEH